MIVSLSRLTGGMRPYARRRARGVRQTVVTVRDRPGCAHSFADAALRAQARARRGQFADGGAVTIGDR